MIPPQTPRITSRNPISAPRRRGTRRRARCSTPRLWADPNSFVVVAVIAQPPALSRPPEGPAIEPPESNGLLIPGYPDRPLSQTAPDDCANPSDVRLSFRPISPGTLPG